MRSIHADIKSCVLDCNRACGQWTYDSRGTHQSGQRRRSATDEIYCNAEKLTLYEHENGDLTLEGRFGEIGHDGGPCSIQSVAKGLLPKVEIRTTVDQIIEDIRMRKMYIEMENEARALLGKEFQSVHQEMRSKDILVGDPKVLDFRKGGCARFRAIYRRSEEIEKLPYPEAAYWAYISGIGVYFGLRENREDMRLNAVSDLKRFVLHSCPASVTGH